MSPEPNRLGEQWCEKCLSRDVATAYHGQGCNRPGCSCSECGYDARSKAHNEHLHYTCRECRFDWVGPVA